MITINGWVFIENGWVLFGYVFTAAIIAHEILEQRRCRLMAEKVRAVKCHKSILKN